MRPPRQPLRQPLRSVAGLGPAQGLATAVVYRVMVLVANLPGGVILIAVWLDRGIRCAGRADPPRSRLPATASLEGAARG